jgi:hypothetical protein
MGGSKGEAAERDQGAALLESTEQPRGEGERPEPGGHKLPPLLSSRSQAAQVVVAGVVPASFGALCGWVVGVNEIAYLVLAVPVAILGGLGAGFEHRGSRSGALRGLLGGTLFGGFILIVHELTGLEAKAHLPEPAIVLPAVTGILGGLLGAVSGRWRQEVEEGGRFLDFSQLSPAEPIGMLAALVLLGSLWLPWFTTSETNPNSTLAGASGGESVNAWDTFGMLDLWLVSACAAPFILSWIIARGHALTWHPGEVTMLVGITYFVVILCNGIILGRPGESVDIGLSYGYLVALLATAGMATAGYLRQAVYTEARKPPGVL